MTHQHKQNERASVDNRRSLAQRALVSFAFMASTYVSIAAVLLLFTANRIGRLANPYSDPAEL